MFNLLCISSLVPPSWQSTLPKYVNLMVYGMSCPLTLIFVGERTLTHMASVFFKLILKPTWLLNMLTGLSFPECAVVGGTIELNHLRSRGLQV